MASNRLDVPALDVDGAGTGTTPSGLPSARYRALTLAADGSLYIATDAGEIWRVTASR